MFGAANRSGWEHELGRLKMELLEARALFSGAAILGYEPRTNCGATFSRAAVNERPDAQPERRNSDPVESLEQLKLVGITPVAKCETASKHEATQTRECYQSRIARSIAPYRGVRLTAQIQILDQPCHLTSEPTARR
jgi:hypothetical protein